MELHDTIYVKETVSSWVKNHHSELLKWAKYKLGQGHAAEDLVQDTFIAAFNSFDRFEGRSHPRTWLFQILNNKIMDHFRKSGRTEKPMALEDANFLVENLFDKNQNWDINGFESYWTSENLLDNPDFRENFNSCMMDLPLEWKNIISDKYFFDKKSEIICQEYQITATNYWQIIRRAKLLLKKCLENLIKS